jgi:hypothetical protein
MSDAQPMDNLARGYALIALGVLVVEEIATAAMFL